MSTTDHRVESTVHIDSARPKTQVRWYLVVGRLMLAGQLAWLVGFSIVQYHRGALTYDFSNWEQARWLITHGVLDPIDSMQTVPIPFWQVNANFLMWPIAEFSRLPPGGLWLLWIQDLSIFGCGWVAVSWVSHLSRSSRRSNSSAMSPAFAVLLVSTLLVANPWTYISAAFDFHWEPLGALFTLLSAYDLYRGRTRRTFLWALLAVATSDLTALYIVGVGLAGLVYRDRADRRASSGLIVLGLAWVGLVALVHADKGSGLATAYAYLAGPHATHASIGQMAFGAIRHPSRPWAPIWRSRLDIWANIGPSGAVGILEPWALFVSVLVLLPSLLWPGYTFAQPSFQNFALYPFVAIGSVLVLCRLSRLVGLIRRLSIPIGILLGALSVGWAWSWLPSYPSEWLAVTPSGGSALADIRARIPTNAVVVASNGIAGRLADRSHLYVLMDFPSRVPTGGKPVYFVLSTAQGIFASGDVDVAGVFTQLSGLGAKPLFEKSGIWLWRWDPRGTRLLVLKGKNAGLPAWELSTSGRFSRTGAPADWCVRGTGHAGFLVWGDYWPEPIGTYTAQVQLQSDRVVTIQVVVPANGQVLATQLVGPSLARQTVEVPFEIAQDVSFAHESGVAGHGIFEYQTWPAASDTTVEVRLLDAVGANTSVYSIGLAHDVRPPSYYIRDPGRTKVEEFILHSQLMTR